MGYAILHQAGGSGIISEDVTAARENVLQGKTTITSDSGDEVVGGTMPNNGAVNHTLPINGSFTIAKGFHSGSGKVSQNVATKGAETFGAKTVDQKILKNRYISGDQVFKAVSHTGLSSGNIKNGTTVKVSSNGEDIFTVAGSYAGTKRPIAAAAFRGFGMSSSDYEPSEEATFTMPLAGTVYYGGISAFYNGFGEGTVEIYKNNTLMDSRNGGEDFYVRGTMVNKSFSAAKGDVIKVKATATSGSATLCMIQAVCIY